MTDRRYPGENFALDRQARSVAGWVLPVALWWAVPVFLALYVPYFGSAIGITVPVAAGMLSFVMLRPGALRSIRHEPMLVMYVIGFCGMAVPFALTAQAPADFFFSFNYIAFLLAVPVFLVARELAGPKTVEAVLWLCLLGAGLFAIKGVLDVTEYFMARGGKDVGALIFARQAMVLGIVAGAGIFIVPGWRRFIFCLGPVLGIATTAVAQARGVMLAIPPVILLFLAFIWLDKSIPARRWVVGAVPVVIIGALGYVLVNTEMNQERVLAVVDIVQNLLTGAASSGDQSTDIRLTLWQAAFEAIPASPIIGHGWVQTQVIASEAIGPYLAAKLYNQFHNDLLNFAVSAGLFGVGSFVLFLYGPIAGLRAAPADRFVHGRAFALSAIVVLYAVSGLTDITFGYDLPTVSYGLMTALVLGAFRAKPGP